MAWAEENVVEEEGEKSEETDEEDDDEGHLVIKGEDDIPKVGLFGSKGIQKFTYPISRVVGLLSSNLSMASGPPRT